MSFILWGEVFCHCLHGSATRDPCPTDPMGNKLDINKVASNFCPPALIPWAYPFLHLPGFRCCKIWPLSPCKEYDT